MANQRTSGIVDTTAGLFQRSDDAGLKDHFAVVYVDLAGLGKSAASLDKERLAAISESAKRAIRAPQRPFSGTEFDKSAGIGVVFERPVDAAAYALAVLENLARQKMEHQVELRPRIGIAYGELTVEGLSEARLGRKAAALEVRGEACEEAVILMKKAEIGQILMGREAFDLARSSASGHEGIQVGTVWTRKGRIEISGRPRPIEVCEVAPPPADGGGTMLQAFNLATSQLGAGLGSGPKRSVKAADAGARTATGISGASKPQELIGTTLGGYRIEALKGGERGRWNFVARDVELQRDVLLRVLPPEESKDAETLRRFVREGLANLFLNHPNVAAGYDAGRQHGFYFIAGELTRGATLRDMVETAGALESKLAMGYTIQAARALAAMHDHGIIHRDVNPDSLVVTQNGTVKFQSFALAKVRDMGVRQEMAQRKGDDAPIAALAMENLTAMGTALGNPEFSAPEQLVSAADVDARADQYSLGCLIVFLLTGVPPVQGGSAFEVRARFAAGVKAPLAKASGAPAGLEAVVVRLLERDPQSRYGSMAEVITALEGVQGIQKTRTAEAAPGAKPEKANAVASPLADAAHRFNTASWRRMRSVAVFGLLALLVAGTVVMGVAGDFQTGIGLMGLAFITPAFHLLIDGLFFANPLFRRVIRLFAHPSTAGVLVALGLLGAGVLGLYLFGLLVVAGVVTLGALGLAVAWQLFVLMPLKMQRHGAMRDAAEELKRLRSEGKAEDQVREALFEAAGADWEEIYEAHFGYDAMLAMRAYMKGANRLNGKHRYAAWRDALGAWLVEMEEARAEARTRRALEEAERDRLQTEGVPEPVARKQAQQEAERLYKSERAQYEAAPMGFPHAAGFGPMGTAPMRNNYYEQAGNSPVRWVFTAIRSTIGTGILLGYAGPKAAMMAGIAVPPLIVDALKQYYTWGLGGSFYALLIGGLVMQNAASTRYFTTMMAALGAVMLVASVPIVGLVNNNPPFDRQMAIFVGATLMFLAYGMRRLTSVGGMRALLPF